MNSERFSNECLKYFERLNGKVVLKQGELYNKLSRLIEGISDSVDVDYAFLYTYYAFQHFAESDIDDEDALESIVDSHVNVYTDDLCSWASKINNHNYIDDALQQQQHANYFSLLQYSQYNCIYDVFCMVKNFIKNNI